MALPPYGRVVLGLRDPSPNKLRQVLLTYATEHRGTSISRIIIPSINGLLINTPNQLLNVRNTRSQKEAKNTSCCHKRLIQGAPTPFSFLFSPT